MYRLRPGAVLCFSCSPGESPTTAEVVSHNTCADTGEPHICYFCRTAHGDGEMIVTNSNGGANIEWFTAGKLFSLCAEDIEVFQADNGGETSNEI